MDKTGDLTGWQPDGAVELRGHDNPQEEIHVYEAPEGPIETALAQIWAEWLQGEPISRHDNFFARGGHPRQVVPMIDGLRRAGWQVDVRTVIEAPTLHALAALARERGGASPDGHLVPIHFGGSRRPLFLLNGVTGDVLSYERLARHLDDDLPVYGLQADRTGITLTVEALARHYVRVIRGVQPHGPYRLAGWSEGGHLAYEMAQQLLGEDESVEFLGMIDSSRSGNPRPDERPENDARRPQEVLPGHLGGAQPAGQACVRYRPQPLPMPLHLFTAEIPPGQDPSHGWSTLLGSSLRIEPIGGSHQSIMEEPHLRKLAGAITRLLSMAQTKRAKAPSVLLRPRCAVTMQSGQAGEAPVFCFPGAGAPVSCFLPFVQAVGPDTPVIGMQGRGHDGEMVPHTSVEAAARVCLQEIRALAPQGPYRLLGHGFGGWIAYELARRLEEAGEPVAPVILVDSEAPGSVSPSDRTDTLIQYIELLEMERGRLPILVEELRRLGDQEQVERILRCLTSAGVLPARTTPQKVQALLRVFDTHLHTSYQPSGFYGGPVWLVNAEVPGLPASLRKIEPRGQDKIEAWQRHAEQLLVQVVPGSNHMTVLKFPQVERLAALARQAWGLRVGDRMAPALSLRPDGSPSDTRPAYPAAT